MLFDCLLLPLIPQTHSHTHTQWECSLICRLFTSFVCRCLVCWFIYSFWERAIISYLPWCQFEVKSNNVYEPRQEKQQKNGEMKFLKFGVEWMGKSLRFFFFNQSYLCIHTLTCARTSAHTHTQGWKMKIETHNIKTNLTILFSTWNGNVHEQNKTVRVSLGGKQERCWSGSTKENVNHFPELARLPIWRL